MQPVKKRVMQGAGSDRVTEPAHRRIASMSDNQTHTRRRPTLGGRLRAPFCGRRGALLGVCAAVLLVFFAIAVGSGFGFGFGFGGSNRFTSKPISFSYPGAWHARTNELDLETSEEWPIVALSPQPMDVSCTAADTTASEWVTCREPISHLRRNSVLAVWFSGAAPNWTLAQEPGQRITVDGITGKWQQTSGVGDYPNVGATVLVDVYLQLPNSPGNYYEMFAEVRGPETAKLIAQLRAMVDSVRFS